MTGPLQTFSGQPCLSFTGTSNLPIPFPSTSYYATPTDPLVLLLPGYTVAFTHELLQAHTSFLVLSTPSHVPSQRKKPVSKTGSVLTLTAIPVLLLLEECSSLCIFSLLLSSSCWCDTELYSGLRLI